MGKVMKGSPDRDRPEALTPVIFHYYVPKKPLSDFVALFWYWRGHSVSYSRERVLPMGTSELVINLRSGRGSEAVICGPQSRSFIIERTAQDELLGIHFRIGGAFPFLGFPCGELHNLNISMVELWGE